MNIQFNLGETIVTVNQLNDDALIVFEIDIAEQKEVHPFNIPQDDARNLIKFLVDQI